MKFLDPITTPRLILRPFREGDLDDLYAYYALPEVTRFLYSEPHDLEKARETLAKKMKSVTLNKKDDRLVLAVEEKNSGRVIGEVLLLWKSKKHNIGEVGYVFNPAFQGQGYATEAAREMLRLGFETCKFHRMIACCDARNTASMRVMERLGMRREAHYVENEFIKGEWTDELIYAMLEREWMKQVC